MAGGFRRFLVVAAGALAAGAAAAAFSSERWLAERADDSDMLRLRAAFAECAKKAVAPAENVSMVLEAYPDGAVKSRITAARATIFPDSSYVWAEQIRLEQFDATGTNRTARLDAENCLVDRTTKTGWVDGNANMVYGDATVKGRGIYFSLTREFIKIFSQSEIRTKGGKIDLGRLNKK